jgi:hypothetical protein
LVELKAGREKPHLGDVKNVHRHEPFQGHQVSIDATRMEEGAAASDIAGSPLWPQPQGQPDWLRSLWQEMKAALHARYGP